MLFNTSSSKLFPTTNRWGVGGGGGGESGANNRDKELVKKSDLQTGGLLEREAK